MNSRLACACSAIIFLLAACASPRGSTDSSPPAIIFEPAAAVYWPLDSTDEFRELMTTHKDELLQDSKAGNYLYSAIPHKAVAAMHGLDDYNRFMARPMGGKTPLEVACRDTYSILFYFVAARPASRTSVSRFTVSYEWNKPDIRTSAATKSKVLTGADSSAVYDVKQKRGRRVYRARLPLQDARRIDGRWTLVIRHRGHELHREVFDVRGCSDTGVPDWYLEGDPTTES